MNPYRSGYGEGILVGQLEVVVDILQLLNRGHSSVLEVIDLRHGLKVWSSVTKRFWNAE